MVTDNLNYIVEGPIYKNFYLSNSILYCKLMSERNETQDEIIHKDVAHFVVNKYLNGKTHIILIDKYGKLIHIFDEDNEWKKRKIENTNLKSYIVKDLNLYIDNKSTFNVNLLLILSHKNDNNLWTIMQYSIKNSSWSRKKVDYFFTEKNSAAIRTDIDSKGNIHLIYKSKTGNNYNLLYRMYMIDTKKWSYPEKINSSSSISNFNILIDSKDNVNVIWSDLKNKNMDINHSKKNIYSSNSQEWKKSKSLSVNNSNYINPILLQFNNCIALIWKDDNNFYSVTTNVNEDDWSDSKTIDTFNHLDLFSACYIGNKYKEYNFVKIPFTYYWSNRKDLFLMGLDTKIADSNTNNLNKHITSSDLKFDEFMRSVDTYFENTIKNSKLSSEFQKDSISNSDDFIKHYDLDMHDFTSKLMNLYYEIENLKNQELILYNSLFEIRSQHMSLYGKIEDILKDYEKLK